MTAWHSPGTVNPTPAGDCPNCGESVFKTTRHSRRTIGGMVFREHICQTCGEKLVSVQMLVTAAYLLDQGISVLTSSKPTR